jgi:hypothetical protein
MPPWLAFRDNGNGTATFSGKPPLTATPYAAGPSVVPYALGQAVAGTPVQVIIYVSAAPVFLDTGAQLVTKCRADFGCALPVHTNMATGTFSLDDGDGITQQTSSPDTGELSFNPTTGGAYPMTVRATNSYGSASQTYTFYVEQAPGFPSIQPDRPLGLWLMVNVPVSFAIPTTGYPHDLGVTIDGATQYLPPMTVSELDPTLQGPGKLPQGISFTDQTSAGLPTGTALFTGTPAEGSEGAYDVWIKADNGQVINTILAINVRAPGDVNDDGQVTCTDLSAIAGQANYNAQADINNDGTVNVIDLSLVAR